MTSSTLPLQLDTSSKENGSSIDTMLDDVDEVDAHPMPETSESSRVKAAIDHLHQKIDKTKEMIKTEQAHKEGENFPLQMHTFFCHFSRYCRS